MIYILLYFYSFIFTVSTDARIKIIYYFLRYVNMSPDNHVRGMAN